MSKNSYSRKKKQYQDLWQTMEVKSSSWDKAIERTARKIELNRHRYQAIEAETNIPWQFIAVIHNRESSLNFNRHLHNGDSLKRKTRRIPKGRPKGTPPFTFEESCIDALKMKRFHLVKDWSFEHQAYMLERYNGWGYRRAGRPNSPYLWSGSNHYTKGKYVRDGKYSPTAVDQQIGTMPLLKRLHNMETKQPLIEVPVWFQLADSEIGTLEVPGKGNNPAIVRYYADAGHAGVKHDSVPWCAAFACSVLERSGIRSPRKLTARSFLNWGEEVTDPQVGDVVVFKRGNSSWQGHVAFFVEETGKGISVLGGNQSDAVNIRTYSKSKLLGYRRPKETKKLTKKEVTKSSRKLTLLSRIKKFILGVFGTGASYVTADSFGFVSNQWEQIETLLKDNMFLVVFAVMGLTFLVVKYLEDKSHQDYEEGRYEPSKLPE